MSDNALTILNNMKGQLAPNARQLKHANQELGVGIQAPFALLGYKGGRWSVRHRGNVKVLERFDERGRHDGYVPFLDLVVLYAAEHNSKVYYKTGYIEGSDSPPDCWSTNGQKPDAAARDKQNPTCLDCRHNVRGSRINEATGAKGKACSDFRRWAVVPYEDIENTIYGGPMLLRIPPGSHGNVGEFSDMLKANSVPYAAIATRVGFDGEKAYPQMTFEPHAVLTAGEIDRVRAMQDHPLVERIVSEQVENLPDQPGSEEGKIITPPTPPTNINETKIQSNGSVTHRPGSSAFSQGTQKPAEAVQSKLAPTPQPPPETAPAKPAANPPEGLTPEQLKIRELEAKLAAAQATPAKAPRKRSTPVAPSPTAEHHQEMIEEEPPAPANDPALANISARLEKLL